jgi:hypothetical protein
MTAAIFGLVGVVIGALATGGVTYVMERLRDRKDGRVARRLLERELRGTVPGLAAWCAAKDTTEPSREVVLKFPAWKLYHSGAAREMSDAAWDAVSAVYMEMYAIRTGAEFDGPLEDDAVARLVAVQAAVNDAIPHFRS